MSCWLWIYRYMRQRQVSLTEPFSDLWSKPSPAPSFLCYPTSVPMLCLLPYQYATAGDIHVWRWADCCILGKILPLFPFLIGTSVVSCLEFAQEIRWVDTGEGVLCWVLTDSPRRPALHPWWDVFFEVGFRASPSVYDSLSIMLQHLLWKNL